MSTDTPPTSRALRVNEKAANLDALQLEAAPQPEPTAPPATPWCKSPPPRSTPAT